MFASPVTPVFFPPPCSAPRGSRPPTTDPVARSTVGSGVPPTPAVVTPIPPRCMGDGGGRNEKLVEQEPRVPADATRTTSSARSCRRLGLGRLARRPVGIRTGTEQPLPRGPTLRRESLGGGRAGLGQSGVYRSPSARPLSQDQDRRALRGGRGERCPEKVGHAAEGCHTQLEVGSEMSFSFVL